MLRVKLVSGSSSYSPFAIAVSSAALFSLPLFSSSSFCFFSCFFSLLESFLLKFWFGSVANRFTVFTLSWSLLRRKRPSRSSSNQASWTSRGFSWLASALVPVGNTVQLAASLAGQCKIEWLNSRVSYARISSWFFKSVRIRWNFTCSFRCKNVPLDFFSLQAGRKVLTHIQESPPTSFPQQCRIWIREK